MVGAGGGAGGCTGRAISGAEVKPQGFLGSFSGSVWRSRAGAALEDVALGDPGKGLGGRWQSGADVKPALGGGGGGGARSSGSRSRMSGISSCTKNKPKVQSGNLLPDSLTNT